MANKNEKDLYAVLGITKDATETDIKKAFKKMALKHHPDKNPDNQKEAEEKFKEIAEAYEILSNKEKKEKYDRYGMRGINGNIPQSSSNGGGVNFGFSFPSFHQDFTFSRAQNIFEEFMKDFDSDMGGFGGFGGFGNFGRSKTQNMQRDFQLNFFGGGFGMNDDFFKDNFFSGGGFDNFGSMRNMSNMSMGGGGTSKSVSSSTIIKNGKTVNVTKTTTRTPDGQIQTEVQETTYHGNRKIAENRYIENGATSKNKMGHIGYK